MRTLMIDLIKTAILQRRRLAVYYDPGVRLIEPHVLGYGSDNQVLLRAFQVSGASASGEPANWKLFRLDRFGKIDDGGEGFREARPLYNPDDSIMKGGIIARI